MFTGVIIWHTPHSNDLNGKKRKKIHTHTHPSHNKKRNSIAPHPQHKTITKTPEKINCTNILMLVTLTVTNLSIKQMHPTPNTQDHHIKSWKQKINPCKLKLSAFQFGIDFWTSSPVPEWRQTATTTWHLLTKKWDMEIKAVLGQRIGSKDSCVLQQGPGLSHTSVAEEQNQHRFN